MGQIAKKVTTKVTSKNNLPLKNLGVTGCEGWRFESTYLEGIFPINLHFRTHTNLPHICFICGDGFLSGKDALAHRDIQHADRLRNRYRRNNCCYDK